jgi:predicted esterase
MYDIMSLDKSDNNEDESGILATIKKIEKIIQNEIDSGIKSENIILGGFSQGVFIINIRVRLHC